MLTTNEELELFLKKQSLWWDDIVYLVLEIFDDGDSINEFFKSQYSVINGEIVYKTPKEVEGVLLKLAKEKDLIIYQKGFPDLLKWK